MKKLLGLSALLLLGHAGLQAQTIYNYTATVTSSTSPASFDNASNYTVVSGPGTSYPVAGDTANFTQSPLTATNYVDATNAVVGTLNFNNTSHGYVFSGTTPLTLNNGSSDSAINILAATNVPPIFGESIQIAGDNKLTISTASSNAVNFLGTSTVPSILAASTGTSTLTVNNTGSAIASLSYLSDNGGSLAVVLNGTGTGSFQLSTENTTGATFAGTSLTIQAGQAFLASGGGLSSTGLGTVTVVSGAALNISGKTGVKDNYVLNGSGIGTITAAGNAANNGALVTGLSAGGQATINGTNSQTVQLASNSTIAVNGAANSLIISEQVTGTGMLTLNGGGALTLNGVNDSYSGGTTITGGSTFIGGANKALGTGNVSVGSATLTLSVAGAFASSGSGLTFTSGSTVNMNFSGNENLQYLYDSTSGLSLSTGTSYTASQLDTFFGGSEFTSTGTGAFTALSVIPEPSTWALFGLGALLLTVAGTRRSLRQYKA